MTIEYTYPERPTKARVLTEHVQYGIIAHPATVQVPSEIAHNAVPEVCEAMMTLAGHEWPMQFSEYPPRAVAERIIARLNSKAYATSKRDLAIVELPDAIAIVREECGL